MKGKVLIVEDEALVALILEDMFLAAGYDVVGVADREADAFAIARSAAPDIAIVDVRLAGGDDGIRLADHLRQLPPQIPPMIVLFATANPDEVRRRNAVGHGCLAKPFEAEVLLLVLDALRNGTEPAFAGFNKL